jgi:recombinational DNA repair ATPase RecF
LRTRVLVLGILAPAERRRFLDRAEAELEEGIREIRRKASEAQGVWEAAAVRGGLEVMQARLDWVRSLGEL